MQCPFCQNIHDDSKFCPQTGQPLVLNNGAYTIVRQLSQGGMGTLYLSEDQRSSQSLGSTRLCVIKETSDYFDADNLRERQRASERFKEEARTLQSLHHPGIPAMFDFFIERQRNFMVMEFIEGENLQTTLEKIGAQPLGNVIKWGSQICNILEYLSSRTPPVVHQDIKPANVIVHGDSGNVYLVDFGTAKRRIAPAANEPLGIGKSSVFGTEGYAPPEQYRGHSVPASDIYALAALLYNLLTGDNPSDHEFKFPRLNTLHQPLPKVLAQCLEKHPQNRPTAKELRENLDKIRSSRGPVPIFHFPDGETAANVTELIRKAEGKWEETVQVADDIVVWLGTIGRTDLARKLHKSLDQHADRNIAIEEFLEATGEVDNPQLRVRPDELDLGRIQRGQFKSQRVSLRNGGRGWLHGSIETDNPQVIVRDDQFSGNCCDMMVAVESTLTSKLAPVRAYVNIRSNGGTFQLPVLFRIAFPWLQLVSRALLSAAKSGVIFTALRSLVMLYPFEGSPLRWLGADRKLSLGWIALSMMATILIVWTVNQFRRPWRLYRWLKRFGSLVVVVTPILLLATVRTGDGILVAFTHDLNGRAILWGWAALGAFGGSLLGCRAAFLEFGYTRLATLLMTATISLAAGALLILGRPWEMLDLGRFLR